MLYTSIIGSPVRVINTTARVAAKPANIKKLASPKAIGFIDLLNEKQIVRYKILFLQTL